MEKACFDFILLQVVLVNLSLSADFILFVGSIPGRLRRDSFLNLQIL